MHPGTDPKIESFLEKKETEAPIAAMLTALTVIKVLFKKEPRLAIPKMIIYLLRLWY
ncbi:hypothetical protein [Neobacillus drentensis]|uniref:hypothetical protein n=1 Tax=Neobacillus drentensis TaxID=220684 RepID=UPI0014720215|nr:hypothetical protein [Neobacillus drentensis]